MKTKHQTVAIFFFIPSLFITGCGAGQPFGPSITPTATITSTATFTPTVTISPTPTSTLTPLPEDSDIISPSSAKNVVEITHWQTSRVSQMAFSLDGRILASTSGTFGEKTIKLWNVTSQRLLHTLTGHTSYIHTIAFSPDGKTFASAGYEKLIILWSITTGKQLLTLDEKGEYLTFSPDGKTLASPGDGNGPVISDTASGAALHKLQRVDYGIDGLVFSPDGSMLAGTSNNTVILWDVASGKKLRTLTIESANTVAPVIKFSPDGKILALAESNFVKRWDMTSGEELRTLIVDSMSTPDPDIAFSPDGRILASLSGGLEGVGSEIILWDMASGEQLSILGDNPDYVTDTLAFSPDGKLIASGGFDGTIRLWGIQP